MWFDDHHPHDGEKIKESFTKRELDIILEFSRFYESRLKFLPELDLLEELHKNEVWKEIVNKAQETAKLLNLESHSFYQKLRTIQLDELNKIDQDQRKRNNL
jgi:hypothetical protein